MARSCSVSEQQGQWVIHEHCDILKYMLS